MEDLSPNYKPTGPDPVADLISKVRYLLEWMPICSVGSSGHQRRLAVEKAIREVEALRDL